MNKNLNKRVTLTLIIFFAAFSGAYSQTISQPLDTTRFYDSAHHWYDIFDEDRVIEPLPEKPRYKKTETKKIADNILLFQKSNGGWAKNFDMQAILTDEQVKALKADKDNLNTTFDNGATHSQLTYLAEAYTILGGSKYEEAFLKGIKFVLSAQYENGGFPQYYPDTSGYRKYITFNDNAMVGVMDLLQKIVQRDAAYIFVSDSLYEKVKKAYEKGIEVILSCQIVEEGIKTAWCQQHDNETLGPVGARTFEKPSICNGESSAVLLFLMEIENPSKKIIESIDGAIVWFEKSAIKGITVKTVEAEEKEFLYHKTNKDRVVVEDPSAPRIWARFYELGTHKPIFVGRDGVVKYSMKEIGRDRRTGYGWYTYAPEYAINHYYRWRTKLKID